MRRCRGWAETFDVEESEGAEGGEAGVLGGWVTDSP